MHRLEQREYITTDTGGTIMFDKITISAYIGEDDIVRLVNGYNMQVITYAGPSSRVEYRSSEYKNFCGVDMRITEKGGRNLLKVSASLHKYYELKVGGKLRNDTMFTMAQAKAALNVLLFELQLHLSDIKVVDAEVGVNIEVSHDPLDFITNVRSIGKRKEKEMFVDANYRINRQKTTEKHRSIRRYFKIYDKGFEMADRTRRNPTPSDKQILRCETVYKRFDKSTKCRGVDFFSDANLDRLSRNWYANWQDLVFRRDVEVPKGTRMSELDRAREVVNSDIEDYIEKIQGELERGEITPRQYRTKREYARDVKAGKGRFRVVISTEEKEFNEKIFAAYMKAREGIEMR